MASSTAAIQFCRECNNMLYPKENANEKTLEFVCKLCPYVEKNVASSCVRVNEIIKTTSQSLEVIPSDLNKVSDTETSECCCLTMREQEHNWLYII